MTRLTTASIKLVMKKSKTNKLGEHPIVLTVSFNGRVEKATSVYLLPKHWDADREQVKRSHPNYLALSKTLNEIKRKANEKRLKLETKGIPYTPKDIIQDDDVSASVSERYEDIIYSIKRDRVLSDGTFDIYLQVYRRLLRLLGVSTLNVSDITPSVISRLIVLMQEDGLKDGTILLTIKNIHSVVQYAIDEGIIPYRNIKKGIKTGHLSRSRRLYYLTPSQITFIERWFIERVLNVSDGGWSYRDGMMDSLQKRSSEEFAVAFFLLCFRMNGSAPCDVASRKVTELKSVIIDGESYYALDFKRKKTKENVSVRWKRDMLSVVLLDHMRMGSDARNGFLFAVYKNGIEDSKTLENFTSMGIRKLRTVIDRDVNPMIAKYNACNNSNSVGLIDTSRVVYYTARHSLATAYLMNPSSSLVGLASILGRSVDNIGVYVHSLGTDEAMVREMGKVSL